jgi:tRNA(Ile)-lysidine synthase
VEFAATTLEDGPGAGESVEAWARQARYRALRQMALDRGIDLVLLAHHRRDQAETFLLQALRGGGVAGLSAMPDAIRREGVTWARPWLEHAARGDRGLCPPASPGVRRRRQQRRRPLRPQPAAPRGLAGARGGLSGAEASLAAAAAGRRRRPLPGRSGPRSTWRRSAIEGSLDIAAWRALSPARQSNLVRAWLRRATGRAAPASLVERLLREVPRAERCAGRRQGELRSYRGRLRYEPPAAAGGRGAAAAGKSTEQPTTIDLGRPGVHELPAGRGRSRSEPCRRGHRRCGRPAGGARASARRPLPGRRRPAAAQPQAAVPGGGPARVAAHGPVLCRDGVPVFVAGLGIDARALAAPGSRSWPWPGCRADRIPVRLFIGRLRPSLRETACSRRRRAPSSWH